MSDETEDSGLQPHEHEMFKNILAFLCMFRTEDLTVYPPEYIKEKFLRYIKHATTNEYQWGMNPSLKNGLFARYCKKWGIPDAPLSD